MCEVENNVSVSWQLVSQFVSWDFCRYMSQGENETSEPDVLTFLRNMVVARTEKRATDITKHEIVAKFIMETRSIRSKSRMPCIIALSETVKRICPELKAPILKLLHHLENLLNVLDWNQDSQKDELILARIAHSVNEFTIKACKVLPPPDLIQVVTSWYSKDFQAHVRKAKQRCIENVELFQKVLNSLREEIITPVEAKTIALALYEDKTLEQFILNSEAETEDSSQQNSQSIISSQVPPEPSDSEQSLQLNTQYKLPNPIHETEFPKLDGPFTLEPVYPDSSKQSVHLIQDPLVTVLSQNSLDPSDELRVTQGIQNLGSLNSQDLQLFKPSNPEPLSRTVPPRQFPESDLPLVYSDSSDFSPEKISLHNRNREKFLQQIRSDISDEENDFESPVPKPTSPGQYSSNVRSLNFSVDHNSGSDTSDCDKDPQFRFLTPTMFKADYVPPKPDAHRVVWLSDCESNNSSIMTNPVDSQKNDPTFKTRATVSKPKDCHVLPPKKRLKTTLTALSKTQSQITKIAKNPRQATLRGFGFSSSTSNQNIAPKKVAEKKQKRFKLYNNDVVVPEPADESALFQKNTGKKKKKTRKKDDNLGNKRRCTECNRVFRTPIELKKHFFIEHTTEDLNSSEDFSN